MEDSKSLCKSPTAGGAVRGATAKDAAIAVARSLDDPGVELLGDAFASVPEEVKFQLFKLKGAVQKVCARLQAVTEKDLVSDRGLRSLTRLCSLVPSPMPAAGAKYAVEKTSLIDDLSRAFDVVVPLTDAPEASQLQTKSEGSGALLTRPLTSAHAQEALAAVQEIVTAVDSLAENIRGPGRDKVGQLFIAKLMHVAPEKSITPLLRRDLTQLVCGLVPQSRANLEAIREVSSQDKAAFFGLIASCGDFQTQANLCETLYRYNQEMLKENPGAEVVVPPLMRQGPVKEMFAAFLKTKDFATADALNLALRDLVMKFNASLEGASRKVFSHEAISLSVKGADDTVISALNTQKWVDWGQEVVNVSFEHNEVPTLDVCYSDVGRISLKDNVVSIDVQENATAAGSLVPGATLTVELRDTDVFQLKTSVLPVVERYSANDVQSGAPGISNKMSLGIMLNNAKAPQGRGAEALPRTADVRQAGQRAISLSQDDYDAVVDDMLEKTNPPVDSGVPVLKQASTPVPARTTRSLGGGTDGSTTDDDEDRRHAKVAADARTRRGETASFVVQQQGQPVDTNETASPVHKECAPNDRLPSKPVAKEPVAKQTAPNKPALQLTKTGKQKTTLAVGPTRAKAQLSKNAEPAPWPEHIPDAENADDGVDLYDFETHRGELKDVDKQINDDAQQLSSPVRVPDDEEPDEEADPGLERRLRSAAKKGKKDDAANPSKAQAGRKPKQKAQQQQHHHHQQRRQTEKPSTNVAKLPLPLLRQTAPDSVEDKATPAANAEHPKTESHELGTAAAKASAKVLTRPSNTAMRAAPCPALQSAKPSSSWGAHAGDVVDGDAPSRKRGLEPHHAEGRERKRLHGVAPAPPVPPLLTFDRLFSDAPDHDDSGWASDDDGDLGTSDDGNSQDHVRSLSKNKRKRHGVPCGSEGSSSSSSEDGSDEDIHATDSEASGRVDVGVVQQQVVALMAGLQRAAKAQKERRVKKVVKALLTEMNVGIRAVDEKIVAEKQLLDADLRAKHDELEQELYAATNRLAVLGDKYRKDVQKEQAAFFQLKAKAEKFGGDVTAAHTKRTNKVAAHVQKVKVQYAEKFKEAQVRIKHAEKQAQEQASMNGVLAVLQQMAPGA